MAGVNCEVELCQMKCSLGMGAKKTIASLSGFLRVSVLSGPSLPATEAFFLWDSHSTAT